MATPAVELRDLGMVFESDSGVTEALRSVNLTIAEGEFVSVVGPSGCGKSTLLGLVAGLRGTDRGTVLRNGEVVRGPTPRTGFVTQQDNLLPWRTVAGNTALALEIQRVPRAVRADAVAEILRMVGLEGFESHYPLQLSGGMRKRVTLARTLIYSPELLLLDEPFGALDAQLRRLMQAELLKIWSRVGCTVLFITHDLDEAILLSDRVVLLSSRPGQVRLDREVTLERPRDIEKARLSQDYRLLFAELWELLRQDLASGEEV